MSIQAERARLQAERAEQEASSTRRYERLEAAARPVARQVVTLVRADPVSARRYDVSLNRVLGRVDVAVTYRGTDVWRRSFYDNDGQITGLGPGWLDVVSAQIAEHSFVADLDDRSAARAQQERRKHENEALMTNAITLLIVVLCVVGFVQANS